MGERGTIDGKLGVGGGSGGGAAYGLQGENALKI